MRCIGRPRFSYFPFRFQIPAPESISVKQFRPPRTIRRLSGRNPCFLLDLLHRIAIVFPNRSPVNSLNNEKTEAAGRARGGNIDRISGRDIITAFRRNKDAGGAPQGAERGWSPTLGTCVGHPTVGKRLASFPHVRKHVGFLYGGNDRV